MDEKRIAEELVGVVKGLKASNIQKQIFKGDNLVWKLSIGRMKSYFSFLEDSVDDLMKEVERDSKKLGLVVDDEPMIDTEANVVYYISDFIGNKFQLVEKAEEMGFKRSR